LRLPIIYLDIWDINDLFDYLHNCSEVEKSAKTGEREETYDNADDMERF